MDMEMIGTDILTNMCVCVCVCVCLCMQTLVHSPKHTLVLDKFAGLLL